MFARILGRNKAHESIEYIRSLQENSKEAIKYVIKKLKKVKEDSFMDVSFDSEKSNSATKIDIIESSFGTIENAGEYLTESIMPSIITADEYSALEGTDYEVVKVYVKDIKQTKHERYTGPIGGIFSDLARVNFLAKKLKENPYYYSVDLKDYDKQKNNPDPIKLYYKKDENDEDVATIIEGNNRINYMKVLYTREMRNAKTQQEKDYVNEKNSFYAHVKYVPNLEKGKNK